MAGAVKYGCSKIRNVPAWNGGQIKVCNKPEAVGGIVGKAKQVLEVLRGFDPVIAVGEIKIVFDSQALAVAYPSFILGVVKPPNRNKFGQ